MKKLEYQVSFTTPAFLGNAEQHAQWRTPPFKALLRQWWRVVYAEGRHTTPDLVAQMRRDEGLLFGVAADKNGDSRKSQIRIRLSEWNEGLLKSWNGLDSAKVVHPEVRSPVGAQLYLGYGPLVFQQGGTVLKKNAAIQSGETAVLKLAVPDEHVNMVSMAFWLMNRFGTLGGRSRNGWGSFTLIPINGTRAFPEELGRNLFCDWKDALKLDWPHCIGTSDGVPLIWETSPMTDWKAVMKRLAEVKIGLRTQFKLSTGHNASRPESRHWLSYPVTNHNVDGWKEKGKGDYRLPNSLRFKVRQSEDGKLHGVIFHVPCLPPAQFRPDVSAIQDVWRKVHAYLDAAPQQLTRIPA